MEPIKKFMKEPTSGINKSLVTMETIDVNRIRKMDNANKLGKTLFVKSKEDLNFFPLASL